MFQFLEVVRLEGHAYSPEDMGLARDMYLLQVRPHGFTLSEFVGSLVDIFDL